MNDTTTLTAPEKLDVRMPDTGILIGAHRVAAGDGRTIEVEDPATGKIIAHVPAGGAHEVDAAVTAARKAFESRAWSRMRGGGGNAENNQLSLFSSPPPHPYFTGGPRRATRH